MIDWKDQYKRTQELKTGDRPKDGDVIDFADIISIEEKLDEFTDKDGNLKKIIRFYYKLSDKTISVPRTLHEKISKIKVEYDDRVTKVKVSVTGTGINTRYDALPVL